MAASVRPTVQPQQTSGGNTPGASAPNGANLSAPARAEQQRAFAQQVKPLMLRVNAASAETSDHEQTWAELSRSKNLAQTAIDQVRNVVGQDGDGFKLYGDTRTQLNRVFDDVMAKKLTVEDGQRRVDALMNSYRSENQRRIGDFGSNAETGAAVAQFVRDTAPSVVSGAVYLTVMAKTGSPEAAALAAGGTSFTIRQLNDFAARDVAGFLNDHVRPGGPDPELKRIIEQQPDWRDPQRMQHNALMATADAGTMWAMTRMSGVAMPLIAKSVTPWLAPRVAQVANTFRPALTPVARAVTQAFNAAKPVLAPVRNALAPALDDMALQMPKTMAEGVTRSVTSAVATPAGSITGLVPRVGDTRLQGHYRQQDIEQRITQLQAQHPALRDAALQQRAQQWDTQKAAWIAQQLARLGNDHRQLINDTAYVHFNGGQAKDLTALAQRLDVQQQLQLGELRTAREQMQQQTDSAVVDDVISTAWRLPSDMLFGSLLGLAPESGALSGAKSNRLAFNPLAYSLESGLGFGQGVSNAAITSAVTGQPLTMQDLLREGLGNAIQMPMFNQAIGHGMRLPAATRVGADPTMAPNRSDTRGSFLPPSTELQPGVPPQPNVAALASQPLPRDAPLPADQRALADFPGHLGNFQQHVQAFKDGRISAADLARAQDQAFKTWQRTFDGKLLPHGQSAVFAETVRQADLARSTPRATDAPSAQANEPALGLDPQAPAQRLLPPATPPNQLALPGSRQYRVFTQDPRSEVRGRPNQFQGVQVRWVDVYAPGTQSRPELRRNAAFNLGGNTPTYGALTSRELQRVFDSTYTVVLRDQPTDFQRALSTVDPDHNGIIGSAYWGNVVNGGRFASTSTPALGSERRLSVPNAAPTLAGQSFQLARDLNQLELGAYNTNTAGTGVADLYRSLGFEVVPEALGAVNPQLRFNGADPGNFAVMRYHINRDLTNGALPSPSGFSLGNTDTLPFASGHSIEVQSPEGLLVPRNHRLRGVDDTSGPRPMRQPPGEPQAQLGAQQGLPFDQLQRSDLSLNLADRAREVRRDSTLAREIANMSWQQHVAKPTQAFVQQRIVEPLLSARDKVANLPPVQRASQQARLGKVLFDTSLPGQIYHDTFGRAFTAVDQNVLRNPKVWAFVDGTAKHLSTAIKLGAVATLAANRLMASNGTLVTGSAVSGDPSASPQAREAARAGNIPKGMPFAYQYAPIPGVPGARAIVTAGVKAGIYIPPATGSGQTGTASPWVGFKPNPLDPGSKEMVATASAIAALGDGELSYNFGTTNFNLAFKSFLVGGRLATNTPRIEVRNAPVAGRQNTLDLRSIVAFDPLHWGATATVNLGPYSITVERPRFPISEKAAFGTARGDNWFNPLGLGRGSNFKPVFSPVATTYDPTAPDMAVLRQTFAQLDGWLRSNAPKGSVPSSAPVDVGPYVAPRSSNGLREMDGDRRDPIIEPKPGIDPMDRPPPTGSAPIVPRPGSDDSSLQPSRAWATNERDFHRSLLDDTARPLTAALANPQLAPARRTQLLKTLDGLYTQFGRALLEQGHVNAGQRPGDEKPMPFIGSPAHVRLEEQLDAIHREFAAERASVLRDTGHRSPPSHRNMLQRLETLTTALGRGPRNAQAFFDAASPLRADGTRPAVHFIGVGQGGSLVASIIANKARTLGWGSDIPGQLGHLIASQRSGNAPTRARDFVSTLDASRIAPNDTVVLVDDAFFSGHSPEAAIGALELVNGDKPMRVMLALPSPPTSNAIGLLTGDVPVWGLLSGRQMFPLGREPLRTTTPSTDPPSPAAPTLFQVEAPSSSAGSPNPLRNARLVQTQGAQGIADVLVPGARFRVLLETMPPGVVNPESAQTPDGPPRVFLVPEHAGGVGLPDHEIYNNVFAGVSSFDGTAQQLRAHRQAVSGGQLTVGADGSVSLNPTSDLNDVASYVGGVRRGDPSQGWLPTTLESNAAERMAGLVSNALQRDVQLRSPSGGSAAVFENTNTDTQPQADDFKRAGLFQTTWKQRLDAQGQPLHDARNQALMEREFQLDPRGWPVPNGLGKQFFATLRNRAGQDVQLVADDLKYPEIREYLAEQGIFNPMALPDGRLRLADRDRYNQLVSMVEPSRGQIYLQMPAHAREGTNRMGYTYAELWMLSRELGREVMPFASPGRPSQAQFWQGLQGTGEGSQWQRVNFYDADPSHRQWYLSVGPVETTHMPGVGNVKIVDTVDDSYAPFHTHPNGTPPSSTDLQVQGRPQRLERSAMVLSVRPDRHLDDLRGFIYSAPGRLPTPAQPDGVAPGQVTHRTPNDRIADLEQGFGAPFVPAHPTNVVQDLTRWGPNAAGVLRLTPPGHEPLLLRMLNHEGRVYLRHPGTDQATPLSPAMNLRQWAQATGLHQAAVRDADVAFLRTDNRTYVPPERRTPPTGPSLAEPVTPRDASLPPSTDSVLRFFDDNIGGHKRVGSDERARRAQAQRWEQADATAWRTGDDGALVAAARGRLSDDEPGVAWLDLVAVDRTHRGQGLGRAVVADVETELARQGASVIRLKPDTDSATPHDDLLRWYQTQGYRVPADGSNLLEKTLSPPPANGPSPLAEPVPPRRPDNEPAPINLAAGKPIATHVVDGGAAAAQAVTATWRHLVTLPTARVDGALSAMQNWPLSQALMNNPISRGTGHGLNFLAKTYRDGLRAVTYNELTWQALGKYQAVVRQGRYLPMLANMVQGKEQQIRQADQAVQHYEGLKTQTGRAVGKALAVESALTAAVQRGDRAAINARLRQLDKLQSQLARPLEALQRAADKQLARGQKLQDATNTAVSVRGREYEQALMQSLGVDTPQVIQASDRLRQALSAELTEQALHSARGQVDDAESRHGNDSQQAKDARYQYEKVKAELARLTLAGSDPRLAMVLDRDAGLAEQLSWLQTLRGWTVETVGALRTPSTGTTDPVQRARDVVQRLQGIDDAMAQSLARVQNKRDRLPTEELRLREDSRIDRLAVDATAARSDYSTLLAGIGYLHSKSKDLFAGRLDDSGKLKLGSGRIDGLSNQAAVARVQARIDQARAEVQQWREVRRSLGDYSSLRTQPGELREWRATAERGFKDALTRERDAIQQLALERRAAEPRSIRIRIGDLEAFRDRSAGLLSTLQQRHAQRQPQLAAQVSDLDLQLARMPPSAERTAVEAQRAKLQDKIETNDYALARAQDIQRKIDDALPLARQVLRDAEETAAVTPGKAARNALRSTKVGSKLAVGLTIAELALGQVRPDTPQELTTVLPQLNLAGNEKPIVSAQAVPGIASLDGGDSPLKIEGLTRLDTVQGPVYAWRARGTLSDVVFVAQPVPQGRGILFSSLFNGGTAGKVSPSIQRGTDGFYLTIDSQRIALASLTVSTVFHPPGSTAVNWWETVKVEFGAVGGALRVNTASTNQRNGKKELHLEGVLSNPINAPGMPSRIRLPGVLPFIGRSIPIGGLGVAVTVKNSLGVGNLSLVYDPDMGVGQTSDRTVSGALKWNGREFIPEWHSGTQPYGFFGTAIRVEKNYYAQFDPRNEGQWVMAATKPWENAFDGLTFKWLTAPATPFVQEGLDQIKAIGAQGAEALRRVPQQFEDMFRQPPTQPTVPQSTIPRSPQAPPSPGAQPPRSRTMGADGAPDRATPPPTERPTLLMPSSDGTRTLSALPPVDDGKGFIMAVDFSGGTPRVGAMYASDSTVNGQLPAVPTRAEERHGGHATVIDALFRESIERPGGTARIVGVHVVPQSDGSLQAKFRSHSINLYEKDIRWGDQRAQKSMADRFTYGRQATPDVARLTAQAVANATGQTVRYAEPEPNDGAGQEIIVEPRRTGRVLSSSDAPTNGSAVIGIKQLAKRSLVELQELNTPPTGSTASVLSQPTGFRYFEVDFLDAKGQQRNDGRIPVIDFGYGKNHVTLIEGDALSTRTVPQSRSMHGYATDLSASIGPAIVVQAHGRTQGMQLGAGGSATRGAAGPTLTPEQLTQMMEAIDENGTRPVCLNSCLTGSQGESYAKAFSALNPQRVVYAPNARVDVLEATFGDLNRFNRFERGELIGAANGGPAVRPTARALDRASLPTAVRLSDREQTITQLLAQGRSYQDISAALPGEPSADSVKSGVRNVLSKLGIKAPAGAADLVVSAHQVGLADVDARTLRHAVLSLRIREDAQAPMTRQTQDMGLSFDVLDAWLKGASQAELQQRIGVEPMSAAIKQWLTRLGLSSAGGDDADVARITQAVRERGYLDPFAGQPLPAPEPALGPAASGEVQEPRRAGARALDAASLPQNPKLEAHQQAVARLLASGMNYAQIGAVLKRDPTLIKSDVQSALRRVGIGEPSTALDLIVVAHQLGIAEKADAETLRYATAAIRMREDLGVRVQYPLGDPRGLKVLEAWQRGVKADDLKRTLNVTENQLQEFTRFWRERFGLGPQGGYELNTQQIARFATDRGYFEPLSPFTAHSLRSREMSSAPRDSAAGRGNDDLMAPPLSYTDAREPPAPQSGTRSARMSSTPDAAALARARLPQVAQLLERGRALLDPQTGQIDPQKLFDARDQYMGIHGGTALHLPQLVSTGHIAGSAASLSEYGGADHEGLFFFGTEAVSQPNDYGRFVSEYLDRDNIDAVGSAHTYASSLSTRLAVLAHRIGFDTSKPEVRSLAGHGLDDIDDFSTAARQALTQDPSLSRHPSYTRRMLDDVSRLETLLDRIERRHEGVLLLLKPGEHEGEDPTNGAPLGAYYLRTGAQGIPLDRLHAIVPLGQAERHWANALLRHTGAADTALLPERTRPSVLLENNIEQDRPVFRFMSFDDKNGSLRLIDPASGEALNIEGFIPPNLAAQLKPGAPVRLEYDTEEGIHYLLDIELVRDTNDPAGGTGMPGRPQ